MKVRTLSCRGLAESDRLDAGFFISPAQSAAAALEHLRVAGIEFRPIGVGRALGKVWQPNRFKRVYAAAEEPSMPYLRPYDVFSFLPRAADHLSIARNPKLNSYRLVRGMILQSCSGRNLGPTVMVDHHIAQFLIGDDMLRLEIEDEELRYYTFTFLRTSVGQSLLRQGMTGSVIDHISEKYVASLQVPIMAAGIKKAVAAKMKAAVELRERSRLSIETLQTSFEASLPPLRRIDRASTGWTLRSIDLVGRVDVAPYDPLVRQARNSMIGLGGSSVRANAKVLKPAGRYKTNYVDALFGTPLVSGTQILQHLPINLQYMATGALKTQHRYELRRGWLAYQADGRADDALGWPVVITSDRDGWLASGHVGRVVPNEGVSVGWLYAALRSPHAQVQLRSKASGSVVDATFEDDLEQVVLPPQSNAFDWESIEDAWESFARAADIENEAVGMLEGLMGVSARTT